MGVNDLKAIESAMTEAFGRFNDRLSTMNRQVLELAQKNYGGPFRSSGEGDELRSALEHSDQLKAMVRGELRGSARMVLPPGAISTKTTILGPSTPGSGALQEPDRASGIVGPAMRRMTVRALLPNVPTSAGATSYTRMSTFTNNAAPQGANSSPYEKEGAVKVESGMTFELVTSDVATIAHWVPVSNQVLNDMAALEQHIRTWLIYGLAMVEEDQLLNGSGTAGNLEGLITAAQTYNRGASNDTRADTLRKAITQLLLADHVCTGIVLNPADDESLDLLKDTTGQYLQVKLNGRAWTVPIIATNSIAAGSWLAGDFEAALVRDRQGATIEISNSHSDFFVRNLLAIRAELREALEIHRPNGFVTGTFA